MFPKIHSLPDPLSPTFFWNSSVLSDIASKQHLISIELEKIYYHTIYIVTGSLGSSVLLSHFHFCDSSFLLICSISASFTVLFFGIWQYRESLYSLYGQLINNCFILLDVCYILWSSFIAPCTVHYTGLAPGSLSLKERIIKDYQLTNRPSSGRTKIAEVQGKLIWRIWSNQGTRS